jgi:hypothetical protein
VGLGLHQGLLEKAPIADGAGAAAIPAPLGIEGLNAPAELVGSATDGLIGTTGTAMEGEMDGPTHHWVPSAWDLKVREPVCMEWLPLCCFFPASCIRALKARVWMEVVMTIKLRNN